MAGQERKPENFLRSRQKLGIVGVIACCVVLDIVGMLSMIFPLFETLDIAWAPISATLMYKLLGHPVGAVFNLLEEIFPYTDFIPTATLFCLYLLFFGGNKKQD